MKFVKGDAIAGLIIVAVNLLGGLLIGSVQRGMSASEAALTLLHPERGRQARFRRLPALLTGYLRRYHRHPRTGQGINRPTWAPTSGRRSWRIPAR